MCVELIEILHLLVVLIWLFNSLYLRSPCALYRVLMVSLVPRESLVTMVLRVMLVLPDLLALQVQLDLR